MAPGENDSLSDPRYQLVRAIRHQRYVMELFGLTRAMLGVTAHGLRHGYAAERYQAETGVAPPVATAERADVAVDRGAAPGLGVARAFAHADHFGLLVRVALVAELRSIAHVDASCHRLPVLHLATRQDRACQSPRRCHPGCLPRVTRPHAGAAEPARRELLRALEPPERDAVFVLFDLACRDLDQSLHPDGYNIGINDGPAAGQTVSHLHVHLIPRYTGDQVDPACGVR